MLHLLIHAQFGYLLHPSIQLPTVDKGGEPLRIADVGTGTGYMDLMAGSHSRAVVISLADTLSARIWIGELTRELPNARIDGFDISDEQYPPENWYGPNVTLSKLDIFQPLPEELKGKYDVVHLRFFMAVTVDDNVQVVIKNLKDMLSKYNLVLSYEYYRLI